jgi:pimeloyl-ACP methyl ester carboxylesterase
MVTHHRFAAIAGRRIFYREGGSAGAPAVVLLHGTPASSHQYRNLIPALADRYHVIAPDYPGFGHSDVPSVDEFSYTFDNLADHVDALLNHLGLQRYAIFVQDYGAPVGWRLALRHPERIAAIITQNGNAYVDGFVGDVMEPLFAYGRERSETNAAALRGGRPRYLDQCALSGGKQPATDRRAAGTVRGLQLQRRSIPACARILPDLACTAAGGMGPQRPDLRPGRRIGVRA